MSDKKKEADKRTPPRTGPVRPADPELVAFLERLWTRNNPPDGLVVYRVIGSQRNVRAEKIFSEHFAADANFDIERCTKLANEIVATAQNDADCNERRSLYEIEIADPYQGGPPLRRRIGPFAPQQAYLNGGEGRGGGGFGSGGNEDDEDTGIPGLRPLTHVYLDKMIGTLDRTLQQVHAVVGDVMTLQQGIIVTQQANAERQQNQLYAMNEQVQNSKDRELDRELVREREKAKLKGINTALRVGENVLAGWLGPDMVDGAPTKRLAAAATAPGEAEPSAPTARYGRSRERTIVENFLGECKEESTTTPDGRQVNIAVELFGDWEKGDELALADVFAGLRLNKPGIFTPAQFGIFVGVAGGELPPEALDQIITGSGKPQEISMEQLMRAQPLITQSMMVALQQLKQLRDEAAAQKAQGGAK